MARLLATPDSSEPLLPPTLALALEEVLSGGDGTDASVVMKAKALRKFGHSGSVDNSGFKTLWDHSSAVDHETLLTSNGIDAVSSSSGSDTMMVYLEGHTISGTDLTFMSQTVTLTGQTSVALPTPLARVTRVRVEGTTTNVGDLYVHEGGATTGGVPDTATEVHAKVPAGQAQTRKAQTAISANDYYFITRVFASVNRQQATAVDVVVQIKSTTGVWLPTFAEVGLNTTGSTSYQLNLDPPLIVAPNSDIRMVAQGSSASATAVSGSFAGYLASIQWSAT